VHIEAIIAAVARVLLTVVVSSHVCDSTWVRRLWRSWTANRGVMLRAYSGRLPEIALHGRVVEKLL